MVQNERLFSEQLAKSIQDGSFVKLALGNYKGKETGLKQIYVKPVVIKHNKMLAFNYRYITRDIFKNFAEEEGLALIESYIMNEFNIATLFTTTTEHILEKSNRGAFRVRTKKLAVEKTVNLNHNKEKKRLIVAKDNVYLQELGLADKEGNVFKHGQDKFKQINRYIEILSPLIRDCGADAIKRVVDMGSGKGYLTFALYDYLQRVAGETNAPVPELVGVEYRQDLVELCNIVATQSGFSNLHFEQGSIGSFNSKGIDLLIALHACDTATDDAIAKGIEAEAQLIVVAPCCHKQIRREMESRNAVNDVSFLTRYGIFMERQAEMVTDGIRALILEYFGYKTKVFEFISDQHTPKNVLIIGSRQVSRSPESLENQIAIKEGKVQTKRQAEIRKQLRDIKTTFGIKKHHLEALLGL